MREYPRGITHTRTLTHTRTHTHTHKHTDKGTLLVRRSPVFHPLIVPRCWTVRAQDGSASTEVLLSLAAMDGSRTFGTQQAPRTLPDTDLEASFSLVVPEVELVARTLRDAWVEAPPGVAKTLLAHEACAFHLSAMHIVNGLPDPAMAVSEPRLLTRLATVNVSRAVFPHWLPGNYFHFVAEVLPKLVYLHAVKRLKGTRVFIPPLRWAADYCEVLGLTNDDVIVLDVARERYHVTELEVLDFAAPPNLGSWGLRPVSVMDSPSCAWPLAVLRVRGRGCICLRRNLICVLKMAASHWEWAPGTQTAAP